MLILVTGLQVLAEDGNIKYEVNTDKSKINWIGTKPGGQHNGTVKLSSGTVVFKDGELSGGSFTIDMSSIVNLDLESETWNKKLVDHLKSEDFFYVEKYPVSKFTITNAEKQDTDKYKITGDLNLRGTKKSIAFTAMISINNGELKATTPTLILDRTQWGVEAMSKSVFSDLKDKYVDDEMQIVIHLAASKTSKK
jgi:polyisoprenoid-binding protein YceI